MSKKKAIPKSQYKQYQTKSRADRQEQVQSSNSNLYIGIGLLVIVLVLIGIYVVNTRSSDTTPSVADRPLANVEPADRNGYYSEPPAMQLDADADYQAIIATEYGDIQLDLFEDESPITVNNFVFLARQGYYDGVTFHRVIEGFMAQGGDPSGIGSGGPGYQFEDETDNQLAFDRPGLLAMANAGPNTNGSQFFITYSVEQTTHLTGLHTIFGEVLEGTSVVESLSNGDLILQVTILEDGKES